MKTITKQVGQLTVTLTIERVGYGQIVRAECEGHKLEHSITHNPDNFNPEDASREIERIIGELAERVVSTKKIGDFLDDFHADSKS